MENPREEVKDVVLGLLQKPTLKGQAEVIRRYCTEDIEFYYLYFNVKGAREMTVVYQVAQLLANYQGVQFEQISYDEEADVVGMWAKVLIRPWPLYWRGNIPLSIYTTLELVDVQQGPGEKTVKKIRVQRDYFEFSPILRVIPVVGDIYANQNLRFFLGAIQAHMFLIGFKLVDMFNPFKLWTALVGSAHTSGYKQ